MFMSKRFKGLGYGLLIGAGVLLSLFLNFLPTGSQGLEVPSEPFLSEVNESPPPEVGWEFLGRQSLNTAIISETEYYSECPGRTDNHIEARFTSRETPPAGQRRVVVRNVTPGLDDDPSPYTDREYYEGRASEATKMRFGTKHSNRYFHVLPGENQFEYEIKEHRRGPVIDAGKFSATIARNLQRVQRDATFEKDKVCANSSVSLDVCADVRNRHKWSCPNGNIIKSEIFPDDRRIITEIHNHTDRTIKVFIDGRKRRINEGGYVDFDDRHPSVRFESGGQRKWHSLTAGTRYRFYKRDCKIGFEKYRRHSGW